MAMRFRHAVLLATAVSLAAMGLSACSDGAKARSGSAAVESRDLVAPTLHPALRGTIAEFAVLAENAPLPVEGYGLVAELPNTGSPEMPPTVRTLLTEQLYTAGAGSYTGGTQHLRPEDILASRGIAAVEVRGQIPPLARRGSTFDLFISAIPNTQTTSLEHGLLWTSEMKVIGLTADSMVDVSTRTIAKGRGPMFIVAPEAGKQANLRSGRVIGGGVVMENRDARFQAYTPSFRVTTGIERAINARWPNGRLKFAAAENDNVVTVRIPPEYNGDPQMFIDLVRHMYLAQDVPGFTQTKASELVRALYEADAPHRNISLALQGLGRTIIQSHLEAHYTSPNLTARFWAARAGAALSDVQGFIVLQDFATNPKLGMQLQAIDAITQVALQGETLRASTVLSELLKSTDLNVRLAAYNGLVMIGSPSVTTLNVSRKFMLDIVPCDAPPLIYASQTGAPRIALIGRGVMLPAGTLYVSKDNLLTVNVAEAAARIDNTGAMLAAAADVKKPEKNENTTLYWRGVLGDKTVSMKSTAHLVAVVSRLGYTPDPKSPEYDPRQVFIGASYQRIVDMLRAMTQDKLINAEFYLQPAPDAILAPSDLAASARPEGSTTIPATQPESSPLPR